jgi:hypothetical protein
MEITIIGTGNMAPSRTRSTTMPLSLGGQPLDVFVASDDERAKQTVVQLVESMGLRPVTPARFAARGSWKAWATCTWPCRSRSAPASAARSRSS